MSATSVIFRPRCVAEFLRCDTKLQGIFTWLVYNWPIAEMYVGDIYRTNEENIAADAKSLIHVVGPPYRAIDLHVTNLSGDPQKNADAIGALVNARYIYDPARPEKLVAFTQPHGTGPHVHLQVHPNTALRQAGASNVA